MKREEFKRLMGYFKARQVQNQITTKVVTKRHTKGQATGHGRPDLKCSHVRHSVHIDREFMNERYTSRLLSLPRI